ncbi:MAG: hypothetical protein SF182_08710 [Deltaproteobacteria bacterium]|nr:hypothetical protein [Deltaproteobacteria bacterium]
MIWSAARRAALAASARRGCRVRAGAGPGRRFAPHSRLILCVLLALAAPAWAQHDHIAVYSTEDGGGDLVLDWDFEKQVQTFPTLCAGGLCLYSTINPAFLSAEQDDAQHGLFALDEGTAVSIEIVAADSTLTLNVDGARLKQAGDGASLGAAPFHNHPSWQVVAAEGVEGDFAIAYKVRAPGSAYGDSAEYASVVTNRAQAQPTPCPDVLCPGDCDDDGEATVAELVEAVELALADGSIESCRVLDASADAAITVDELVRAVAASLDGCPAQLPATLAEIQSTIFTPTCAITTCHNAAAAAGDLVLAAGASHAELVGVAPDIAAAGDAGLLRVTAGDPDSSFLYRKLVGPRPEWGSRMPLNGACMPVEQLDQIRRWIVAGALP